MRKSLHLVALAVVLMAIPPVSAQEAEGPVAVHVDLHVISFGNYDVNKGTYTMDLYLHLWYAAASAPTGFDPLRYEFMNGRAASKELLSDETMDGQRDLWWRIQANLYTETRFGNYPFDHQRLTLVLEDAVHPANQLTYVASLTGTGLDDKVNVAGWRIAGTTASVDPKPYPFDDDYSRFTFTVEVEREPLAVALRSFLPPLAFMVVSGLSFALHPSKMAQRITLGTSMLISAVGFHVSQTVSLPTLGRLTFFDQVMLACYAFLAASLVVTTMIAYNEDVTKSDGKSARVNRAGLWLTVACPIVVFVALRLT